MAVSHHVPDPQVFDDNQAMAVNYLSGNLMMKIISLVSLLPMEVGDGLPGLRSVGSALLPAGQLPLFPLESCLGFSQMPRIADLGPIGKRGEVSETDIDADHSGRHRALLRFVLGRETGVPVIAIPSDCARFHLTDDISVHLDFHMTDLGKLQFAISKLESRFLGVSDTVVTPFCLEARISGPATVLFQPAEKTLKSTINPKENILQNLGVDLLEQ